MSRTKPKNHITSPESWAKVNETNKQLLTDFIEYCHASNKADRTCHVYENDLKIVMTWILEHANNVNFTSLKKRDYVKFNGYLVNDLQQSPNRIASLKSVISSLSKYIERMYDDEYPNFRNLSSIIEGSGREPVWEKNIVTKEEIQSALEFFVKSEKFQDACMIALMYYSGMRMSEVIQTRVDDFTDEHLVFNGRMYKTHTMRTKGRGKQGKQIGRYVFVEFKPYYDMWMKARNKLGLDEESLFVSKFNQKCHSPASDATVRTVVSHLEAFLGHGVNPHCIRHTMVTENLRDGWSQEAMCDLIQWESIDMVKQYNDAVATENIEKFFANQDKLASSQEK